MHLLSRWYVQVFLIIIAVIAVYAQTVDVPFYLDDFSSIQENPVIYQWKGTLAELWNFSALRILGYYTFALNFQTHQFELFGYHLVNITIHALAGVAVFAFVRSLMQTPTMRHHLSEQSILWLPILVALLFVLHPLQTQAVTYIVQRLASLAALFYIAALACYLQTRLATTVTKRTIWLIACLILCVCAFFTKQNTATLPLAFLLLELLCFPLHIKRLKIAAGVMVLGLIAGAVLITIILGYNPFSLEAMQALTQETQEISRLIYLATQFSVLWAYIGLFFFPVGQHIDYFYPLATSFWNGQVLFALAGHLMVIGFALSQVRRLPLLVLGILFYYLAHLVESSVIPITDVVFEHRTYLPNLGLCLLSGWFLLEVVFQWFDQRHTVILISIILITLGITTWQRNQLWRDPIALWQDNTTKSPKKERGWVILGKHLIQANRPTEGLQALQNSVTRITNSDGTQSVRITVETMLNMVVAHRMLKQYDQANNLINQALSSPSLRPFDRAKFLVNQGNIFYEQHLYAETEAAYRQAIEYYPEGLTARANLASILAATGREAEAIKIYEEILKIDPNNAIVLENLKTIQSEQYSSVGTTK
ncbi:tetratricopeptide repeat protein [Beggiatoa leptomitoformis]|uniref:Tetratricopeptide repeat protein n=1 Tax=Beggiatoa leptomitoformis TaxID=288004 RepID=A0A2N9YDV9_9GAMM|nr:tetratricopeptide repeat protein [Beggiatoa leptomitoformis]ALG68935.1 tetratricopeptide repeat protein [Beggiatoa leptomitoformis]AUI68681.1 tetratricopeptide repeat protein [Beggiatoa leptomitoformis]